jgi:hypothetical protein
MARVGSLLSLALAFGGCSHSAEPSYEEPPLTPSTYAEAVAESYCGVLGPCCAAREYDFAEEACLEFARLASESQASENSWFDMAFDPEAAAACVDAISTLDGCVEPPPEYLEACQRVYVGIVPLGEPCRSSSECVGAELGETECPVVFEPTCITREPSPPLPGVGEPCTDFCGERAYCHQSTFTCTPRIVSGSCAGPAANACAPVSYCDAPTTKCLPKAADGETCEWGNTCLSGGCNDGVCGTLMFVSRSACSGFQDPI